MFKQMEGMQNPQQHNSIKDTTTKTPAQQKLSSQKIAERMI